MLELKLQCRAKKQKFSRRHTSRQGHSDLYWFWVQAAIWWQSQSYPFTNKIQSEKSAPGGWLCLFQFSKNLALVSDSTRLERPDGQQFLQPWSPESRLRPFRRRASSRSNYLMILVESRECSRRSRHLNTLPVAAAALLCPPTCSRKFKFDAAAAPLLLNSKSFWDNLAHLRSSSCGGWATDQHCISNRLYIGNQIGITVSCKVHTYPEFVSATISMRWSSQHSLKVSSFRTLLNGVDW